MSAQKIEVVKFKRTPNIIISGGLGSLAHFVIKLLLSTYKEIKITAVDNLESGSEENVKEFLSDPRFLFIKHDLNLGIPEGIKIADAIIHLASSSPHLEESGEEASLNSLLTNAFSTRNQCLSGGNFFAKLKELFWANAADREEVFSYRSKALCRSACVGIF